MKFDKKLIKEPNEKIIYKTVGNLSLPMNIYYPIDGLKEKNPTVICVHGGAWRTEVKDNEEWTSSWMDMNAKYYAQNGFVGIAISYRSIDYTEDTTVSDLVEDVFDAVRYIKENLPYVDCEKIIAIGDSAGGHLVSCLGISEDDFLRPQIVIACNPVLDCTREKWHYSEKTDEKRKKISPLYNIKKGNLSKFLCMHGDNDTVVEIEDTYEFSEKLKENGGISDMITIKGAKHAFILFDYQSSDEEVQNYMGITMEFIRNNREVQI